MATRSTLLSLITLGLGIGLGSAGCKGSDDGNAPGDSGQVDVGPKDTGADSGRPADSGSDTDAGVDTGIDGGGDRDAAVDDGGRADGGHQGPGVVFRAFDLTGEPLAGAAIRVGGNSYAADSDGVAFIPGLSGEQVFTVSQAGHQTTPFGYDIPATTRVLIDATLEAQAPSTALDDSMYATVTAGRSAALIPADSLQTAAGADITGMYEARLLPIDLGNTPDLLAVPLPFVGRDAQGDDRPLEMLAAFDVEVTQNGAPLEAKPGAMVGVGVVVPAALAGLVQVGDIVPAWSYDPALGRWVQEMDGMIGQTPFGEKIWQGQFTHFSWWAAALPFDSTCLDARASDADANPIEGALVRAIGLDHAFLGARFSGADGDVCLEIEPGASVAVSALHEAYASLAQPVVVTGGISPTACGGNCVQAPLELAPPACLEGVVLDGQGGGYANARVQVRYLNSSGQAISSFTTSDAQGGYCALGAEGQDASVVAADGQYSATATVALGAEAASCGQTCSPSPDLILADFIGGCVHGTAEIYLGMGSPLMQAPAGTPIHIYSGGAFAPNCDTGQDDPATWAPLIASGMVGANGEFCMSAIPLGPTLVVLGDCTTWPSAQCGPMQVGVALANQAVCGQPGCFDLGAIRYNMVCD